MKGPPGCPPRGVPFAAVALVVAYMLSPIFCIWFLLTPNISVLDTQALLRRVDDFMPADEFARIQACLRDHPLTGRTLLSDEGFSKTRASSLASTRRASRRSRMTCVLSACTHISIAQRTRGPTHSL